MPQGSVLNPLLFNVATNELLDTQVSFARSSMQNLHVDVNISLVVPQGSFVGTLLFNGVINELVDTEFP